MPATPNKLLASTRKFRFATVYRRTLAGLLLGTSIGVAADQLPGVFLPAAEGVPVMVAIPGGCTEIGSMLIGSEDNPPREVCLSDFFISKYEITYAEFEQFLADRASPGALTSVLFKNTGNLARFPVTEVSWFDAMEYAIWLSNKTGRTFRLPTEEEWEYAARAGAGFGTQYSWGNRQAAGLANCRDCAAADTAEGAVVVGQFPANAFGLHDMHGNVAEWTTGCYHGQDEIITRTRSGQRLSVCRVGVVRGGSWRNRQDRLTFWFRGRQNTLEPAIDVGFRLVME